MRFAELVRQGGGRGLQRMRKFRRGGGRSIRRYANVLLSRCALRVRSGHVRRQASQLQGPSLPDNAARSIRLLLALPLLSWPPDMDCQAMNRNSAPAKLCPGGKLAHAIFNGYARQSQSAVSASTQVACRCQCQGFICNLMLFSVRSGYRSCLRPEFITTLAKAADVIPTTRTDDAQGTALT